MHGDEFDALKQAYPLPVHWSRIQLFAETTCVNGVPIEVMGMSAENASGQSAHGSAGNVGGSPVQRAYFELLERAAIVDAMHSELRCYEVLDRERRSVGF